MSSSSRLGVMKKDYSKLMERRIKGRGFSLKTVKSYVSALQEYQVFYLGDAGNYSEKGIKTFMEKQLAKGNSPQTVNLKMNALKFFYRDVCATKENLQVIKPVKKNRALPVILSKQEIQKILEHVSNKKHHLLLSLSYGAGLRVSETVALTVGNIDFDRNLLTVMQGKGKKDRQTLLPSKIRSDLLRYCDGRKASDALFESERGGALSLRTAQKIFENTCVKAKIKKDVSFHTLRHSFATHLLENGVNIRYIQELLGHANIRTTQLYLQVSNTNINNIESPL